MRFLFVATILISLTVYAYDPDFEDEEETEVARDNSWVLGRPDNIPETEVIILKDKCECLR